MRGGLGGGLARALSFRPRSDTAVAVGLAVCVDTGESLSELLDEDVVEDCSHSDSDMSQCSSSESDWDVDSLPVASAVVL